VIWCAFVLAWTASLLIPAPDQLAREILAWLFPSPQAGAELGNEFWLASKSLHIIAYALLTILSGWLRVPWPWRWLLLVFISIHGFGTELLQHFIVGRHASLRDVGLDHLGALLGLVLSWKWWLQRPGRPA
jgi:VanZ family protein